MMAKNNLNKIWTALFVFFTGLILLLIIVGIIMGVAYPKDPELKFYVDCMLHAVVDAGSILFLIWGLIHIARSLITLHTYCFK